MVQLAGGTPVFVDCDDTFCMNVDLLEAAITPRTKALMPVHLYGQMADMGALMDLARQYRLAVIEDAAQSIGARRKIGGESGCSGQREQSCTGDKLLHHSVPPHTPAVPA